MKRPVAVRVVGPMGWIGLPALACVVATILLATPVKLFGLHLPELVFPMVLAFAWPLIRPSMLAPAVLFALGIFLDVFWAGRLGLWPLVLLGVYGVVLAGRPLLIGQETPILFVWYASATTVAMIIAYAIVGIGAGNAPSILTFVGWVVPTLLLFPLADRMIERFDDGDVRYR